ncbi:hypothetical protein [Pseudomonas chlororaphis]|uniref:Uncharacterized protein n=1 Tax=Pseudomonas chlororaphis TaxID=587753 RepID=A0A0D5Y3Z7_9PSED|nr:hypothetical protein [Pseudomonas chlororaphis]AKA25682.1 hypothetical protein PCL1606_42350 [Pseudomonas chlororaphis]
MSDAIVHACSTLCNPDLLSEQQARAELKRVNDALFGKDLKIIELKEQVHSLNATLVKLAKLQLAGNYSDIYSEMQRLGDYYQQQMAVLAARQVH